MDNVFLVFGALGSVSALVLAVYLYKVFQVKTVEVSIPEPVQMGKVVKVFHKPVEDDLYGEEEVTQKFTRKSLGLEE